MTCHNGIDGPPKSALKYTCTDCGGEGMGREHRTWDGSHWHIDFDHYAMCLTCFGTGVVPMSMSEAMKIRADAAQGVGDERH